ncbi:hypothetical protein C8R46DRAFT_1117225 [Mycena filopes]|nr:hypothetical protein C8R46DRAFT_1117225 [Mycena filopes]
MIPSDMTLLDDPLTPTIKEILGPGYFRQSYTGADLGIPDNWHENWDILRTTLESLKATGMDPFGAVLGLLHTKVVREETDSVDKSSVADLQHHLGTNYVPSQHERTYITAFCAQGTKRMEEIGTRIRTQHQCLMSLDGRYMAQYQVLKPYTDLISPVRALPPEILQEIFMACLPTKHFAIMHASEAPLVLGRVCSRWRAISLSTPALWSSIHIVPSALGDENGASLTTWLERSGNCTLRISIAPADNDLSKVLAILLPYSRRWMALKMPEVPAKAAALWNLSSDAVPLLEELELVNNDWDGEETVAAMQFFTVPRNLRSVSLPTYNPLPACPWSQITDLRLHPRHRTLLDLDAVVGVLSQCVNLQSCHLTFPPSGGVPHTPRVTLLHLKTLTVLAPSGTTNKFLDRLTLPALKELCLDNTFVGPFGTPDMMSPLNELLLRSECDLHKLSLHLSPADLASPLAQCLRRLPNLAVLELHVEHHRPPPDLTPVFQGLGETAAPSSHLCPALRVLKLVECDNDGAAHAHLAALIRSRCSSATSAYPLKAFNLSLRQHWSVKATGITIAELRWGGLPNVSIGEAYAPHPKRLRWQGVPAEDIDANFHPYISY